MTAELSRWSGQDGWSSMRRFAAGKDGPSLGRGREHTPGAVRAAVGHLRTGPLVSVDGSVDWLCLPRLDSAVVFCALLDDADAGRWRIAALDGKVVSRHYRPGFSVLDTSGRPRPAGST